MSDTVFFYKKIKVLYWYWFFTIENVFTLIFLRTDLWKEVHCLILNVKNVCNFKIHGTYCWTKGSLYWKKVLQINKW